MTRSEELAVRHRVHRLPPDGSVASSSMAASPPTSASMNGSVYILAATTAEAAAAVRENVTEVAAKVQSIVRGSREVDDGNFNTETQG